MNRRTPKCETPRDFVRGAGSFDFPLSFPLYRSQHRHAGHAGAAFGAAAGAAAFVAGFLVELATTHFLLDAAVFDQFPKSSYGFLNRFPFAQTQLDHEFLRLSSM